MDRTRPLMEAQEGLWYVQALDPANPILNTGQYVELRGPLDVARFQAAFDAAVAQTPALSLRFGRRDGRPVQWLAAPPVLAHADLSALPDPAAEARARMAADSARARDLADDPLAGFTLYRLGPDHWYWYQRIHHLATDGYAFVMFTNRVGELYTAAANGTPEPPPFAPLEAAFEEDAAWRDNPKRAEDRAFWLAELKDLGGVAGPGPAGARALSGHGYHRHRIDLPAALMARLTARAGAARTPWPEVLTLLSAAYLSRVSGEGARVTGLPYMARLGTKAARVPCMWMNVLPFRWEADEDMALNTLFAEGAARLQRLRRHGRYRSEQMRRDLRRTGIDERLYGPLVNIQPFDVAPRFAGMDTRLHILSAGAVDDLTVTFRGDARSELALEVDTNPGLYTAAETQAHAERLAAFLEAALAADRLADVPTVTPAEHHWLVEGVNATAHPLPDTTLDALIAAQMRATPDAAAVVFGDTTLSYAELDRRTAALAAALRARGAGPGRIVAVALPRSEHLAVALVATLRAGAAFVPLDPENPPARLATLLARTEAVVLLAEAGLNAGGMAPFAPADWPVAGEAPEPAATPGDLAYVLFTSGSTGEPKGVMIEHRAIVNRLLWMRDHYGFGPADRILQKTPTTFDVSVWELFLPYLSGATLVFAAPGAHRDPAAIARAIRGHGITALHFVPSMLSAFLAAPASEGIAVPRVFASGEELTPDHRRHFHARIQGALHNLYGPTEAAVDVSWWEAGVGDTSAPLPIGWPVWNTALLVLDARMRPVPPGVPGELYLGGVQLARGYLGRDDLTAAAFRPDPFHPGARLYATGDLALRRADGAVVYLGRADHQVKIRGMRVELGEIEAEVRATGLVAEAVVLARADAGGPKRLVAYVVPADRGFSEPALTAALALRLPAHMLPAATVALPALPVTANGKLDRRALPAPLLAAPAGTPPRGPVEERIAALYAEVLHLTDPPPREADFFALGGDSLSALTLALRLEEVFSRAPGLGQIFETPGIAALARAMEAAEEARSGLSPLLALRQGEGPPLVLIHPAGGLGWCYRRLARALESRPVWALQSPLMEGGTIPATLAALAADYAARIAALAPEGPVHLAGWSLGGILAQDIAVELAKAGRPAGVVALIDAYPAECWRAEPEPDAAAALRALLAIAGHDPDAHPDLDSRAKVVAFLGQHRTPLGSLPEPVLDAVVRLVTGTNRMMRSHHHRHLAGTLFHIRAGRDHAGRDLTAARWAPHADAVEGMELPLKHAEMLGEAAVAAIAPALEARMRAADQAAASASAAGMDAGSAAM
ncbi:amino acid adenylation domain-containing protein [Ruixingdingia sedimenti]|uniref:Amino acid adenylation domain-containing protein n=1 Tax=Ruixingdingia sedimenti TaxID=3073604 RepID=A0ABU1F2H0_9RHOB|nr:amino acid adenylation domain-containing protein [Xinfangfangia sp. LG-4]MDR5651061.1 amino acid adenylation domain-containing protein [Xinfangfangia sp. LG-4]